MNRLLDPSHRASLRRAALVVLGTGIVCAEVGVACSANSEGDVFSETTPTSGAGASGATTGSGAGSGTGGEGGTLLASTGPTGTGGASSSSGGSIDPDAACATSSAEATLLPLNMFVVFDKSGSMSDSNKWVNATNALKAFVQDPAAAGLRIALRFFPDEGCEAPSCNIDVCSVPQVAIGTLTADPAPMDVQEQLIVDKVNEKAPGGGTPMYAALAGGAKWSYEYKNANPTEKTVVILITDGEPTGCNEDINAIAGIATGAQSAGIYTYAVGMVGSNEAQMNTIAQAGGTMKAILIGNGNAQAELLAALKLIQASQLACEFLMPEGDGGTVDLDKVNVNYTPGGGMAVTLGQVAGANVCSQNGGWYYDFPAAPTKIMLCPSTCAAVQADAFAKIEVLLGCETKPAG